MSPIIIGISGVTGAGKTTLVKCLSKEFNATALYWDDFDDISISPSNYIEWYHRGQQYNEWNYTTLAEVLKALKVSKSTLHPTLKKELQPTEYIFFDSPLGRLHNQTGKYIDIWFHIEVPLDVSLCRRLIRDFKGNKKTKKKLITELEFYLMKSRPLFFDDKLKTSADVIIDGLNTIKNQIDEIKKELIRYKALIT